MSLFLIETVQAAEKWKNLGGDQTVKDVATIGSLPYLFKNIVNGVTAFSGVILFAVLVLAGFTFLFSGGDAKQLEKAKNSFTYALIGIIVIICSYLIISFIGSMIGVDLTSFNLNIENK